MKCKRYAFILTANPKYWERLRNRNKISGGIQAFVRKNQVAPRRAQRLLFYVTKPVMQVKGVADFIERLTGDSEDLWRKYGSESCFKTFKEYCDFAEGREMMTFVRFTNFVELENPKTKEETKNILGSLQGLRGKYVDIHVMEQFTT
jgi:predicted transcriptional regulator